MRKLKERELLRFFPRKVAKVRGTPKWDFVMDLWSAANEARKNSFALRDLNDLPPLKKHQPLYDGGYDKFVSRGHANSMVRAGIRIMDNNALRFKYFPGDRWIDHEYWREKIYHRTVHSEKLRLNRTNRRRLRRCIHKKQVDFDWSFEERIEPELLWERSYFHRSKQTKTKLWATISKQTVLGTKPPGF